MLRHWYGIGSCIGFILNLVCSLTLLYFCISHKLLVVIIRIWECTWIQCIRIVVSHIVMGSKLIVRTTLVSTNTLVRHRIETSISSCILSSCSHLRVLLTIHAIMLHTWKSRYSWNSIHTRHSWTTYWVHRS